MAREYLEQESIKGNARRRKLLLGVFVFLLVFPHFFILQ